jgi:hypothetical protein
MSVLSDFKDEDLLIADTLSALRANTVMIGVINVMNFPRDTNTIRKAKDPSFEFATVAEGGAVPLRSYTESEVSVTAVKGAARVALTHEAMRFRSRGNFGTLGAEAGRAAASWIDGQALSLISGFSQNVGTSGSNLTVTDFRQAAYLLDVANVPGPYVAVLHPVQVQDIQSDLLSTSNVGSAYVNAVNLEILGGLAPQANGFRGLLFDVAIFASTSVPTANVGADRQGLMFNTQRAILGAFDPEIYTMDENDVTTLTANRAFAVYAGFAELEDASGITITTDA